MEHQLNFTVTKDLITIATRRFWLQFVGWVGLIRWAVISTGLFVLSVLDKQAWSYGPIAFIIVCIPLIWGVSYFTFLRRAFHRYDQMQNKQITYRFTEQGLGTKSDLGSAEIPWRMLEKVLRYHNVWLLFFGRRDYAYLPVAEMSEPLKDFIRQQAEKHGVKAA